MSGSRYLRSALLLAATTSLGAQQQEDAGLLLIHSPIAKEVVAKYNLDPFYEKCCFLDGFPIISSKDVPDRAHREAAYLIRQMLAGRPELLAELVKSKTRLVIIGVREKTTEIPEYTSMRPKGFWNVRARGFGPSRQRNICSNGEEDLLGYPGAPCGTESILVHEFAHAIHAMALATMHPEFNKLLQTTYRQAMSEGLWKSKYAATNPAEYWAEGVQSWFDTNRAPDHDHNWVDKRDELDQYDPRLAALIGRYLGDNDWRYQPPRERLDQAHLRGFDPKKAPRFAHAAEDRRAYREHLAAKKGKQRRDGEDEVTWLKRVAKGGDLEAQIQLGFRYRDGDGVDRDHAEAVRWYAMAAARNNANAQDCLGWMHKMGYGVPADAAEAKRLFRLSAEQGWAQGQYNLALMLRTGDDQAQREATSWLQRAAKQGHRAARKLTR
ncbi:MAG: hypothetical protein QF412_11115 [Planctomycetota bacterium]|jgi:hypothetical protein|nr:hypothetical protein [Planctomycetota bacterium]